MACILGIFRLYENIWDIVRLKQKTQMSCLPRKSFRFGQIDNSFWWKFRLASINGEKKTKDTASMFALFGKLGSSSNYSWKIWNMTKLSKLYRNEIISDISDSSDLWTNHVRALCSLYLWGMKKKWRTSFGANLQNVLDYIKVIDHVLECWWYQWYCTHCPVWPEIDYNARSKWKFRPFVFFCEF